MIIMRTILAALLLLFSAWDAQAQINGNISGKVNFIKEKEGDAKPSVALLHAKDSSVLKQTTVRSNGSFVFDNLPAGDYMIAISFVGFDKWYSQKITLTKGNVSVQLQPTSLAIASKSLNAVTITAKKPWIEQKVDRMVVNVEASPTNIGATALELMEKLPGVSVDKDGNISLKGKEGVMVLVDGRPTQLGGTDLANLLRNTNSSQLDQIEIMTNPPARYDAAGNAGIINIKTKKRTLSGYNGSLTLGYTQGRYPKTNEGFNFNYRSGNINLFGNLGHSYRQQFNVLTIQRNIRNAATKQLENYFDQVSDKKNEGHGYNARLGFDYFVDKKTTIGLAASGFYNPSTSFNKNQTDISSSSGELENITLATVENIVAWKNSSANLNFRRVFDSAGRELTAELDYMVYDAQTDMLMVNSYWNPSAGATALSDTLKGALPQKINIQSGRIDYVHPLKGGARWEAGLKTSLVETESNAMYDSVRQGNIIRDRNRSNHFVYNETIHAAYVNLSQPLTKKISAQLGLRLESTIAKGEQLTTGQHFSRQYTQLFPTAYFQYKLDEKNNLGLNYGRRIRRPNYESLNPFIRFLDRYTYSQGNPDLRPQFSHNIEFSHTYRNRITTTLNYTATDDIIQSMVEQKGQEAYARQSNIASLRQYGVSINISAPVTKWWMNNLFFNVYSNNFKGLVSNEYVSLSAVSFAVNGTQQFTLSKTLSAELSGVFRSSGVEGVMRVQSRGFLAAGFSQQILKNYGTLRLTVRDIFFTQQARARAEYANVDMILREYGDSRVVSIGFSYRFSKGKTTNQKKKTNGSANEEQNRVGAE